MADPAIQPPTFPDPNGGGGAPIAVCGRWMGSGPCGAAGSHHVIWNSGMHNGCICDGHAGEIRQRWVYLGLHPYTAACASVESGRVIWLPGEDRCVTEAAAPDPETAQAATMIRA